ncbi:hypothetical protein M5689_023808 [Euphorbia peplus]|nr:hypothetical protein M5689_023808 [Euphorbia peplus]
MSFEEDDGGSDQNGAFTSMGELQNNNNGDVGFDNDQCNEAANFRILQTGKLIDNQMADILLGLRPLGLKLTVSSIMSDNKQSNQGVEPSFYPPKFDDYSSQPASEKLKAANFEATLIKIGKWERKKKNEGDITAKCYFAKKKLVWEFLQGNLKSKIEIQWNDIIGLRVDLQENKLGILEIELNKAPDFFEEIDPQPRKHTIWRVTSDFTKGAASTFRRHYVEFPPGMLDKHYEKLLQCDQRLYGLHHKPFPSLRTPYFDQNFHKYLNFSSDGSNINVGFQFEFSSISPAIMANQPTPPRFNETFSPVSVMDFSPSDEPITSNINVFDHTRMSSILQSVPPTPPFIPCSRFSGQETYQDPNMVNYMLTNVGNQLFSENQVVPYDGNNLILNEDTFYVDESGNSRFLGEITNNARQHTFYGSSNHQIGGEVAIYRHDPLIQQAWENLTDPRAENFGQDIDINHWR